jgi:hypothetical protein
MAMVEMAIPARSKDKSSSCHDMTTPPPLAYHATLQSFALIAF